MAGVETVNLKFTKLSSHFGEINRVIQETVSARVLGGAKTAVKIMRKNANKTGKSIPGGYPAKQIGKLKKSIGYINNRESGFAMVGSNSPKIHLLEFGHGDGKEKNKRPLIRPSLMEAEEEMIDQMFEKFW